MSSDKKRGGWQNPASATNGKIGGRPRKLVARRYGVDGVFIATGDRIALFDGFGITEATATVVDGALKLTNDKGQTITITLAE